VLVDRYFPNLDCCYVVADNLGGGYRATEHLIILGHTQISFLYHHDADLRTTSVRDRYLGYRKALADYNIEFNESWACPLESTPASRGDGRLAEYIHFLENPGRPPAVFAVNDNSAIDLLTAAVRMGLRVPSDLAEVGFDNLRMSSQVPVPLTTINVHRTEMGEKAADLLLDRIEGRIRQPQVIVLPTELIVRESCGARLRLRKGWDVLANA
jgi:DNA-binding LacI/PurR family transcriptional regulator